MNHAKQIRALAKWEGCDSGAGYHLTCHIKVAYLQSKVTQISRA